MPGKVKVKIVSGRNLPIMDRSNLTTDAYVEVKLGSTVFKTDVYRKSLNPVWNSEWFRFEMDDLELQDEPLQIRLMDHDTYSSNDAIGKVYLDLNPLLCNSSRGKDTSGKMISGWIPVYDTMHGIRGEVNLIVKVELFSDLNKFRQSSCGVRFFFTQSVPEGYIAHIMQGFVEELVVNDDPEYQWIDKIRTPRASNEARQTLFSKLSGEVQRRVGLKALELGGNAVIGYKQCFDLEGESGIVVRGIGTAVYLTKQYENQLSPTCGESLLGLSREFAELQGYRSFAKTHRSFRRRGGPGRAPRLHRRSFRMPSSSDSVSELHQQTNEDGMQDDAIRLLVPARTPTNFQVGTNLANEPSSGVKGLVKHGSPSYEQRFKERTASFRDDSITKLVKLKKSLTASARSVPLSRSMRSSSDANKENLRTEDSPGESSRSAREKHNYSPISLLRFGKGKKEPSSTPVTFPVPNTTSQEPAPRTSHSTTAFQKCSTPVKDHTGIRTHTSHSPLCKSRRVVVDHSPIKIENPNCNSDHSIDSSVNTVPHSSGHDGNYYVRGTSDEPSGNRSRSALASCMMHNRAYSDTMRPALSNQTASIGQLSSRMISKSVNELNTTDALSNVGKPGQFLDYLGSGGEFESGGSNLDSNEDSTSDTSMRYIHEIGPAPHPRCSHRIKREVEFESDTSKEFTKLSSGNEACSVDNDDLSPVSERGFLLLRKKRGSRRKDRYSKSNLMKRASANFAERGYFFGGTEKIREVREEVAKFFKRKKSSDDNESCSSSTKNASTTSTVKKCSKTKSSPYRETKFFFRRRRTSGNNANKGIPASTHYTPIALGRRSRSFGQLFRSNSESHSIGQTSLDSMPSVGSEPLFDPEDDDSSHAEPNIYPSTKPTGIYRDRVPTHPTSIIPIPNLRIPEDDEEKDSVRAVSDPTWSGDDGNASSVDVPLPSKVIQLGRNEVVEIIEELGYSTESPLNLYISSMDALLVYDPCSKEASPSFTASAAGGSEISPCACPSSSASAKPSACNHSGTCSCSSKPARDFKNSECANCNSSRSCTAPLSRSENNSAPANISGGGGGVSEPLGHCDNLAPLSSMSEEIKNDEPSSQANDDDSTKLRDFSEVKSFKPNLVPIHDNNAQSNSSLITKDKHEPLTCDFLPVTGSQDRIIVYRASNYQPSAIMKDTVNTNFGDDEEYLIVMSSTNTGEPGGVGVDATGGGIVDENIVEGREVASEQKPVCHLHDNTEELAINRSPIPEELLSDRTTPTALSNMTQTYHNINMLTGGVSNFSVSTTSTNNSSSHQAQSSSHTVSNNSHLINSNNSHGPMLAAAQQGRMLAMSNSTEMGPNNNNDTGTTTTPSKNGTGGGGNIVSHKRYVAHHSAEESPTVARNDSDGGSVVPNDSIVPKTSLPTTATPSPSRPACDPQHYHCQAYGCPINHRLQRLHQQPGLKESYEMSIDAESAEVGDESGNKQGNGSSTRGVGNALPKTPTYIGHPIPKIPFGGPSPVMAPNHANMTTTIITSGTGTVPMVMGSGNCPLHRRSSESDLSTPPKPTVTAAYMRNYPTTMALKGGIAATVDQYGLMEYPFITISQFPPGFLTHIGGTVTARSVKLLERISNLDEPESRDAWWNEIRMEIRAHCRAFGCTVVVGYEEHTTMCDDVCVLSASGTAAIAATTIGLKNVELLTVSTKQGAANPKIADAPCPGRGVEKDRALLSKVESMINAAASNGTVKHVLVTPSKHRHDSDLDYNCSMLHIPPNSGTLPFPVKMSRCQVCRKSRVPDVLIATVDMPPGLHVTGKGTLLQAQVFRPKKDCKGETSAKEVSDSLPFLEYELHRRLINKLKVKGMNAIFGLKVQICLGDKLMVALATGTAMYLTALPPPGVPIITAGNMKTDAQKVLQYQKVVQDAYDRNRQHYDLKNISLPTNGRLSGSSGDESEDDDSPDIQNSNKDTYILEVDDAEDIDIISMLIDPHPSSAFFLNNIDYLHGYAEHNVTSQQMFTQVWRCRIPTLSLRQFTAYFERLIRSVCFKLRKMMPCVISKLSFRVDIPEQDEMQIALFGLALGMADQTKVSVEKISSGKSEIAPSTAKEDGELIFPIEDDGGSQHSTGRSTETSSALHDGSLKDLQRGTPPPPSGILVSTTGGHAVLHSSRLLSQQPVIISSSPLSHGSSQISGNGSSHVLHSNPRQRFTVEITPLSYIPGAKIEKYLGNLNFFFIRETTSIRENGGLSGFVHNFVAEVLAIVRAHVGALGGNAMVSYFMTELALLHNPHKNQGQCLINVGGDVVLIVHPISASEDPQFGS